ncbi:MAG: ATP-binding protein [Longimicrobiales bacterium]
MKEPVLAAGDAGDDDGPGRLYTVPLFFITLALLALVAVPVFFNQRLADVQDYMDTVVDPAMERIARIQFLQARQFSAVQGFVLTGDRSYREQYRRADDDFEAARDTVGQILAPAPAEVRALLGALDQPTTLWTFNHLPVLNEEVTAEEAEEDFTERDRGRYEDALAATAALLEGVRQERVATAARLDGIRSLQVPFTAGLVALSLFATLTLGLIGRRMGGLVTEVQSRRGEAVRARRQTEAVMAATADGVVGLDLDGNITSVNQAGIQLLDYSTREIIGRNVHELLLHTSPEGEQIPTAESALLRGLRLGEAINLHESVLWRRDGTSFPVQLQLRPLIDGLEVKGGVLTFTDVREQREIAEALRQALRGRDEVLAVVSHDLRNPVGTVFSAADLLLEVDFPLEKRREHLSIIKRSAARMNRLIQDLLDVARIEAGGFYVTPRVEDITSTLREACELARPRAVAKEVELACEPDDRLPPVKADRDRILQVLSNLIGNAIKFTPASGRIVVGASAGDHEVVVRIADTGPGIPGGARDHVFDRFWQVKRSDRAGAGLGLAIVKGIVESHGGRVWVDSAGEEGSVFCFTLPTG